MRQSKMQTELRKRVSCDRSVGSKSGFADHEDRPVILSICQSEVEVPFIGYPTGGRDARATRNLPKHLQQIRQLEILPRRARTLARQPLGRRRYMVRHSLYRAGPMGILTLFPNHTGGVYGLDQPIYQVDALRGKSGVDSLRTPNRRSAVGTTLDSSPEKDTRGGKSRLGTDRRIISSRQLSNSPDLGTPHPPSCLGTVVRHCGSRSRLGTTGQKTVFPLRYRCLGSCTILLLCPNKPVAPCGGGSARPSHSF